MTSERLSSRTNLLSSLDRMRRDVDLSGDMNALDAFTQQAVGVVKPLSHIGKYFYISKI